MFDRSHIRLCAVFRPFEMPDIEQIIAIKNKKRKLEQAKADGVGSGKDFSDEETSLEDVPTVDQFRDKTASGDNSSKIKRARSPESVSDSSSDESLESFLNTFSTPASVKHPSTKYTKRLFYQPPALKPSNSETTVKPSISPAPNSQPFLPYNMPPPPPMWFPYCQGMPSNMYMPSYSFPPYMAYPYHPPMGTAAPSLQPLAMQSQPPCTSGPKVTDVESMEDSGGSQDSGEYIKSFNDFTWTCKGNFDNTVLSYQSLCMLMKFLSQV